MSWERRRFVFVAALAMMAVGCAPQDRVEPAPLVPVPSATTETTIVAFDWDGDPASFESPLDHLDRFRYEMSFLHVYAEGGDGPETRGLFAAPDAVTCTLSSQIEWPETVGTVIAIDDVAYFDGAYSWIPPEGSRGNEDITDWLRLCPGADEFWRDPFWLTSDLVFTQLGGGDVVEGYPTIVYEIRGTNDEVVITSGSMWVTSEGWPIQLEIEGTVIGGEGRLRRGPSVPHSPKQDQIDIHYRLTDINGPGLAVGPPG